MFAKLKSPKKSVSFKQTITLKIGIAGFLRLVILNTNSLIADKCLQNPMPVIITSLKIKTHKRLTLHIHECFLILTRQNLDSIFFHVFFSPKLSFLQSSNSKAFFSPKRITLSPHTLSVSAHSHSQAMCSQG